MILDYDKDPNLTPDEKIKSLKENIQLALDEQQMIIENLSSSLLKALGVNVASVRKEFRTFAEQMQATTEALSDAVEDLVTTVDGLVTTVGGHTSELSSLDSRLDAIEPRIPAAPAIDGAYKLTVTVTGGTPVYTWVTA